MADQIRNQAFGGLWVGMRFPKRTQRTVKVAAGQTGVAPPPLQLLAPNATVKAALDLVFAPGEGEWVGYHVTPALLLPAWYAATPPLRPRDRLFFHITIKPFKIKKKKVAFVVFPVVAILAAFGSFEHHYALGLSALTLGRNAGAAEVRHEDRRGGSDGGAGAGARLRSSPAPGAPRQDDSAGPTPADRTPAGKTPVPALGDEPVGVTWRTGRASPPPPRGHRGGVGTPPR